MTIQYRKKIEVGMSLYSSYHCMYNVLEPPLSTTHPCHFSTPPFRLLPQAPASTAPTTLAMSPWTSLECAPMMKESTCVAPPMIWERLSPPPPSRSSVSVGSCCLILLVHSHRHSLSSLSLCFAVPVRSSPSSSFFPFSFYFYFSWFPFLILLLY